MNGRPMQKGFTLIELLISIAVTSLILAAGYTVYFGSTRAATMQTQDSRMQDNARMAMDVLTRHIKLTGFLIHYGNYPLGQTLNGMTTKVDFINSNTGPDSIRLAGLPNMTSVTRLQDPVPVGGVQLKLVSAATYSAGDIIGIGLADSARVVSVDQAARTVTLDTTRLTGAVNLEYEGETLGKTPATINRLMQTTFFIDASDPAHPFLMQQDFTNSLLPAQPVAEDIEDMQFEFGVDMDNNMVVDMPWINSAALTTEQADKVRMVRVTIVARASQEDLRLQGVQRMVPTNGLPYGDRPAWLTADGYRRYILTRIIGCRNINTFSAI